METAIGGSTDSGGSGGSLRVRGEGASGPEGDDISDLAGDPKQVIDQSASTSNLVEFPQSASTSKSKSASTSTLDASGVVKGFFGIAKSKTWRPKMTEKNAKYPRVTAPGCYFQDHSGGFALIDRKKNKYLAFYTKEGIAELERQYGKKRTSQPRRTKRTDDRDNRNSRSGTN